MFAPCSQLAAQQDTGWFANQTSSSFWAHLSLRSYNVTQYDLDICGLYHDLVLSGAAMSDTGLHGAAGIFGAVLRRYSFPDYNRTRALWAQLPVGTATEKFRALSAPRAASEAPDPGMPARSAATFRPEAALTDYIFNLAVAKAKTASFRDVDCVQPDTERCFTACSLTAYRDEVGLRFPHVAPWALELRSPGGHALVQWVIANRVWLESLRDRLPEVLYLVPFPGVRHACGDMWWTALGG